MYAFSSTFDLSTATTPRRLLCFIIQTNFGKFVQPQCEFYYDLSYLECNG